MARAAALPAGTSARSTVPLTLQIELNPEQRELLVGRFGLELRAVPFRSTARSVRCTVGGISIRVDRDVFVPPPRAERILRVAEGATASIAGPIAVDVGTGSGALALAYAAARPDARVFGTEISERALRCARHNRARLRLRNTRILRGSLLEPLPARLRGRVTLIVANVPYLPPRVSAAADGYFPEHTAVGLGPDGLDLVRMLADSARQFLASRGQLILQLGAPQWPGFQRELASLGYDARLAAGDERAAESVVVQAEWRTP